MGFYLTVGAFNLAFFKLATGKVSVAKHLPDDISFITVVQIPTDLYYRQPEYITLCA